MKHTTINYNYKTWLLWLAHSQGPDLITDDKNECESSKRDGCIPLVQLEEEQLEEWQAVCEKLLDEIERERC